MDLESPHDDPSVASTSTSKSSTHSTVSICLWLAALFLITSVLMMSIVPRFGKMFKDFDAELPGPTVQLVDMSRWYVEHWHLVTLGCLGTMYACGMLCRTGCAREARWIRNLLAVAVFVLLLFAGVAVYLPFVGIMGPLS